MHQLTIGTENGSVTISDHPNCGAAHRALLHYVVSADYYLHRVQSMPAHSSYHLLRLADPDDPTPARRPRIAGTATIIELPHTQLPVSAPYFVPCDAQRLIADHNCNWLYGSATDPATAIRWPCR